MGVWKRGTGHEHRIIRQQIQRRNCLRKPRDSERDALRLLLSGRDIHFVSADKRTTPGTADRHPACFSCAIVRNHLGIMGLEMTSRPSGIPEGWLEVRPLGSWLPRLQKQVDGDPNVSLKYRCTLPPPLPLWDCVPPALEHFGDRPFHRWLILLSDLLILRETDYVSLRKGTEFSRSFGQEYPSPPVLVRVPDAAWPEVHALARIANRRALDRIIAREKGKSSSPLS